MNTAQTYIYNNDKQRQPINMTVNRNIFNNNMKQITTSSDLRQHILYILFLKCSWDINVTCEISIRLKLARRKWNSAEIDE